MPPAPRRFPVEALPSWMSGMVNAVSATTKTDPSLGAMMALATLSAAAARKAVVVTASGFAQPLHLWVLVAAGTGTGKSPVFARIVQPLRDVQRALSDPAQERAVEDSNLLDRFERVIEHDVVGGDTPSRISLREVCAAVRDAQASRYPGVAPIRNRSGPA